ncbi:hypothetical protein MTO96_013012 [Rhipicephalus appendiculatus]
MRSQGRRGRESGSRPRNQVARARVAAAAEPKVGPSRKKPALAAAGREDDDARINLLGPLPLAARNQTTAARATRASHRDRGTIDRDSRPYSPFPLPQLRGKNGG